MVAIVSGNSLGLSLTSLATLGQRGTSGTAAQGRNGEQAYVNIATGNLVLQDFDDRLDGRGLDVSAVRTYNSQGLLNDDNGDNWSVGAYGQRVVLSGTAGAAGSTVTRTDRDGAQAVYNWDSIRQLYVSTAGGGAFDTIAYDSGAARFVWTDGSTGLVERYQSTGQGHLLSVADPSGNTITLAYNAEGTLNSLTSANGEVTYFDYTGTNLAQVRTVAADGTTLTRVHYAYDPSNRLSTVTVDLSPDDNSVADGQKYVTTYTYDGTSKRIASVAQSDGTSLAFTYVQVGSDFKVSTVNDGIGNTTSYIYLGGIGAAGETLVRDPQGRVTAYYHDADGQLSRIDAPAVNGVVSATIFGYNTVGDLVHIVDGEGHTVDMQYDANGNQVLQRDSAGNTVTRTYDIRNQLLTETTYLAPDPDGAGAQQASQPLTTRYVYEGTNRNLLRFALSAEGRVTEYRYDSYGQRISTLEYAGGTYDTSALSPTGVPTESQMVSWAGGQDRTQASRTDIAYDTRGQIQQITAFSKVDASGAGIADGSQSVTHYVYDRAGQLLSTVSATNGTTQYTYDGLGRQLSVQDALGNSTLTSYDDAGNTTTVALANGLHTISVYDHDGHLISVQQRDAASTLLSETTYLYRPGDNQAYLKTDPTGIRTGMLYDNAGRLIAQVSDTGQLVEYVYNKNNQITETIAYANPAYALFTAIQNAGATGAAVALASFRPTSSATDERAWRIYDNAGRLARTIDAAGAVTDVQYDGASRVIATIKYSQPISLASIGSTPTLASTTPTANAAQDRITRSFYDGDGLLRATLDAEGYLSELHYDGEGRLVSQTSYAKATDLALRATGGLAQLVPAVDAGDQTSYWLHDAQGRTVAEIDAEGYLTERVFDASGNVTQTVRYATRVSPLALAGFSAATTVAGLRPSSTPEDRSTSVVYDKLNRVSNQTNYEGSVTRYSYDNVGNLVSTTTATGTPDARTLTARYDIQGRLIGELDAVGSAMLTGGQTQQQIDAIWAQHGLTHQYDAAGRLTGTEDALGQWTLFFYDRAGNLTHTVNTLGEVTERQFNTLGQLRATIQYANRIDANAMNGGIVNSDLLNAIAAIANPAKDSVQTFTYNATGTLATSTDALGNVTSFAYDAFREATSSSQALGDGRTLAQTQTFDRRGLVTGTVADASGINAITSAVYDAFGRATRSVDANGNVSQQSYDRLGHTVVTVDALNAQRSANYDAFDRVLSRTDALGNITSYSYNKALRSVSVTSPEHITVTTVHNRYGQTQQVVDGNGNTTSFSYDKNGNLTGTTTPLTTTSSTYDATNRLIQTTDANGNVVTFSYDAASRLLSRTVSSGDLNLVTAYQYDAKGQQIEVTDPDGTVTQFTYDLKGQLRTQAVDPAGLNLVTTYSYDARGKTLSVLSPGGMLVRYAYDTLGRRVQERVDPNGLNLTRNYAYDKNANVVSSTDANGNVTRYAYDADNRLVFTLDALGNLSRNTYDAEGRIVRTTDYATPIDTTGLGAAPNMAQIESRVVASSAADSTQYRILDKDGRLTATVNELGEVVKFAYDADGNVIERLAFSNRIDLAGWTPGTAPAPAGDAAHDQRVRYVYDALGRAIYTVDGTGAVVQQRYDGNGNVLDRIAYAAPIPVSTSATATSIASAVALVAQPGRDAHDRFVYDGANRLTWHADGAGAVTQQVYDDDGNLIKQIQYATAIGAGAAANTVTASAADRITDRIYDKANRQVFVIDALGTITWTGYDKNGNATMHWTAATPVAAPTATSRLTETQADNSATWSFLGPDRTETAVYDAANRMVLSVDSTGAVTEMTYDGVGNNTRTVAYANRIDLGPLNNDWNPSYAKVRSLLSIGAADRITTRTFDADNRLQYSVDPLGHVSKNVYDGLGRIAQTTSYALAIPAVAWASSGTIAASLVTHPQDRTTHFAYDAEGRLSSSTDALGFTQRFTYNALGEKTTFTNEAGAVWNYDYDAAGHLTQETAPAVQMTSVTTDGSGNLVIDAAHTGSANLITRMAYDALGNLLSRTEALGRPEQRTTSYEYDTVGHQVKVIYPPVGVYNPSIDNLTVNGASGLANRAETQAALFTQTRYDVFGDAISNLDVAGNMSYKTYDALGRVSYEVDAMGFVTGYQRNGWGEVVELARFANPTGLTGGNPSSLSTAQVNAAINAPGIDHGADRLLTTEYDRAGRVVKVIEPQTFVYDSSAPDNIMYFTAGKTTVNTYNAFGNLTQVAELKNAAAQQWLYTDSYYDLRGQQVATVDALGYLSTNAFDGAGNLVLHKEFATAIAGWNGASPGSAAPVAQASGDDRATLYAFDQDGRKTSETRLSVEYSNSANGTSMRGDLATSYGYDAVGNLTRTTDATGATTYSYYDALGRVRAVATPTLAVAGIGNVTPLTEFLRDAYGNAVVTIAYARGAATANAAGYSLAGGDSTDRATYAAYDRLGHVVQSTDANRTSHYSSYDAQGHLAKEWQLVTDADNVSSTLFKAYQYDKLGQQTHIIDPASRNQSNGSAITTLSQADAGLVDTAVSFNAFGEVTGKSVNGAAGEYFDYDNAGRVWRTNAGDGVDKVAFYNLQGQQTAQITSYGSTAGNDNLRAFNHADELAWRDLRRTDTVYDALGHVVQTVGAQQNEYDTGPSNTRVYTHATVGSSSSRLVGDEQTASNSWTGTNSVTVSWASLRGLGSGDVKVVMQYATQVVGDPAYTNESSQPNAPQPPGVSELRTRTQIVNDGADSVTMSWNDDPGVNGGISRVTQLTIYKKDLAGNWQVISDQSSLGYGSQVIDIDSPADPTSTVQLQLRPAGSEGDSGWASVGLTNFGTAQRFNASGLSAGAYEYRALMTTAQGVVTQIGSGRIDLTAPPLASINTPMGFYQPGVTGQGLFTWPSPGNDVDQVFRFRPSGSNAAWSTAVVSARGDGKDGVDMSTTVGGLYDYELLWIHAGEGVPYAHATGQVLNSGFQFPQYIPPVNMPIIPGVEVGSIVVGTVVGHDESGPIYSGPTSTHAVIQWPVTHSTPAGTTTFRYRLQGTSDWQTLPLGGDVQNDEGSLQTGTYQVDLNGLAPGNYEYQVLITQASLGIETPQAQATGNVVINPQGEGHNVPTLLPFPKPVTITPDDPANHIIGWTDSEIVYGPPVVVGTDINGRPIFGQGYGRDLISNDESTGPIYGPVHAIPYYTYTMQSVTENVPVQVAVGQDPVPMRDEAGNIITTPVYQTVTGTQTVGVQVQVGTDPVYARDEAGNVIYQTVYQTQYQTRQVPVYGWVQVPRVEAYQVPVQGGPIILGWDENGAIYQRDPWGNIQYYTNYETQYRVVYDWAVVQTGWQDETYAVQVPVQQPVITGYQPRYETQYVQVPYSYQVQTGTEIVYERDGAGNIVYQTRYETQMQQQTHMVSVPTLVTPTDPSQFIISTHTGDPIYGPPVMVPTGNESGATTQLGKGYELVNGVVVAVPYVEMQTEWRWVDIWVDGTTPPPTVTDTTPPYTPGYITPLIPPLYNATVTTMAGSSAVSETGTAGAPGSQAIWQAGSGTSQRAVVNQNTDRWGNVVSISDPRSAGWVTTYRYNANNQLVEQKQTDADGNANTAGAAVTQLFYDAMGRQVAVKDANGNVQGKAYDAAGNVVQELNADGGVINHAYNTFGDMMTTVDAMGFSTSFTYDNLDRLLSTTHMAADIWGWPSLFAPGIISTSQIVERNTWDQAGRKLTQTDGAGATIKYAYDLRGNLVSTTQPMGQVTSAAFDALNRKIAEVDANGAIATWRYDYFGELQAHTDIGGASYGYTYDNARQLVHQTSSVGQNLTYTYDTAGHVARIDDASLGKVTTYAYDLAGHRIRETTVQGGVTYQDNQIAYDALGRMRWVADTHTQVTIDYDKVGNRTHVHTTVHDDSQNLMQSNTEINQQTDSYFLYDAMNRQVVVNAANAQGGLGTDGHRLTYDLNGNRTSDTHNGVRIVQQDGAWVAAPGETTEVYAYDSLNRLASTTRDGAVVEARGYDAASRVIISGPGALGVDYINLHRQYSPITGNDALQGRNNMYDGNGRLVHQATTEYLVSASAVNYTYDNVGNVLTYLVADTLNGTFTTTTNTVGRAEGYRTTMSFSQTTSALTGALVSQGGLGYDYDANGYLRSTGDPGQITQPSLRTHNFVNDANGNALYAYYAYEGTPDNHVNEQRQLVVNGEVLGRYGLMADNRFAGTSVAQFGPFFTPQSDFSFGYQPIDGSYPAGTPGSYAVGVSDTLQSIAKGAYGDASLWYLIADANGLSGNGDLKAGQVLQIPTATRSANNANTFKPYDPSKIANDSPTMMAAPQSQDGGCGGLGQVIVAVIAVVVAVVLQQYELLPSILGAATPVAAAAIGDVAGQAVGIAIGAQESFSWKEVALSAISAGVAEGVGKVLPNIGRVATAVVSRALGNAITQGIGVALGLQKSFSWKSVAASAVSAGVTQGLNIAMDYDPGSSGFDPVKSAVSGLGGSLAGQAARGGRISSAMLASDAFGNVIGDSLAAANGQSSGNSGSGNGTMASPYVQNGTGDYSVFNNTLPSNDFARVNAVTASAFDFGGGGSQGADLSSIMSDLPSANPYANLSMSDGVQLAGSMTGGMLFGPSGQLTPNGPYIDLPKTPVTPVMVMDMGSLPTIAVESPASGGVRSGGTGGRGELSSSAMYAAGYGDIRMTETPISSMPYEPFESDYPVTAQASTPPNAAEVATSQTIGDFLNTGSLQPYNPNWQADVVRNTLNNAIAQQTARNTPSLTAWNGQSSSPTDSLMATARTIDSLQTPAGAAGYLIGKFAGASESTASTLAAVAGMAGDLFSLRAGAGKVSNSAAATEAEFRAGFVGPVRPSNLNGVSTWQGAGPIPGTFGVNPTTKSVAGLSNYSPKAGAIEFIFDPNTSTFVVGAPKAWNGSPHETLANSVGADPSRVVGGMFRRDANGQILTNENSGHYHQNWTPEVRQQFTDFMRSMGVPTVHSQGM